MLLFQGVRVEFRSCALSLSIAQAKSALEEVGLLEVTYRGSKADRWNCAVRLGVSLRSGLALRTVGRGSQMKGNLTWVDEIVTDKADSPSIAEASE